MEDQPADSGDLTTESAPAPTAEPAAPRRRGFLRRRRAKETVAPPEPVGDEQSEPDADARRVPTGKSRRAPKPADAVAVTEPDTAEPDTVEPDAVESGAEPDTEAAADSEAAADNEASEADAEPEPEPVFVPHRPAGKRLLVAAAAASVLFVAAGAFAGATVAPYLIDRAAVDTKLTVARTATEAITTLWTYTPDDMAALPDRSSQYLAGDFASEYRRYIDAIVATNKQAQVTNTTQVMGAAVESLTPTEATALVYTNSVATSPVNKNIPSLRYLSYRLTLERHDARWLITGMNSITSLDLTPQL